MSFKYKKIPNFYYWCGTVSHDDKECSLWLASKGSLSLDQQEYGAWLRASLSSSVGKTFMAVEGFGNVFGEDTPSKKTGADPPPNSGTTQPSLTNIGPSNQISRHEISNFEDPNSKEVISQSLPTERDLNTQVLLLEKRKELGNPSSTFSHHRYR